MQETSPQTKILGKPNEKENGIINNRERRRERESEPMFRRRRARSQGSFKAFS